MGSKWTSTFSVSEYQEFVAQHNSTCKKIYQVGLLHSVALNFDFNKPSHLTTNNKFTAGAHQLFEFINLKDLSANQKFMIHDKFLEKFKELYIVSCCE